MTSLTFSPIAHICSSLRYRSQAPRQAVYSEIGARIVFEDPKMMRPALEGIEGFERLWLIFAFHLNLDKPWKAKVRPPFSPDDKKFGLFATRSPYRPNPIGMSAVTLLAVEKDTLVVGGCDLLDGTPILDIKPYIPQADAFPTSRAGWRDTLPPPDWTVTIAPQAIAKINWVHEQSGLEIQDFCQVQLSRSPLDNRRKRVTTSPDSDGRYGLGLRTWQILFTLDETTHSVTICDIKSNYPIEELTPLAADPYGDKEIHRQLQRATVSPP